MTVQRSSLFALCLLIAACQPEIGDSCDTSVDCSTAEARLCDTTLPSGYCTVFNCDPGSCPEEARCIGYRSTLSSHGECSEDLTETRLQRTYCMRKCSRDSECRPRYRCADLSQPNVWSAVVLEESGSGKVCVPRGPDFGDAGAPSETGRDDAVCGPTQVPESE